MKKRILSLLLAALLCLSLLPLTAAAEGDVRPVRNSGTTSHGVNWTLYEGGELRLTPSSKYAYLETEDRHKLPSYGVYTLVIDAGLEYIPNKIFVGMPDLRSVTINGFVKEIGEEAFKNCERLEEVTIHGDVGIAGLTSDGIRSEAFQGCKWLNSFQVDGIVSQVCDGAFSGDNLYRFDAPICGDIGKRAFQGNEHLYHISPIRGNVGGQAFDNTSMKGKAVFVISGHPANLEGLLAYNDTWCSSVKEAGHPYVFFNGCEEEIRASYQYRRGYWSRYLGEEVYWELTDGVLTIHGYGPTVDLLDPVEQPWVNIPGQGTWDEQWAAITKVRVSSEVRLGAHMLDYLPDNVEYFYDYGYYAHSGDLGTLKWGLAKDDTLYVSGTGTIPNLYDQEDTAWMPYRDLISRIVIEDGVTAVGFGAFNHCRNLQSVEFADSVTRIDGGAFYGCHFLWSAYLPEHLTTIGRNAFTDCTGLKTIYIPKSVTSIGSQAFQNTGLLNIYYGGTTAQWEALHVTGIGDAFVHMSAPWPIPEVGAPAPSESDGSSDGFSDVTDGDWFFEDVAVVYFGGYMLGTSSTAFSPALTMDRAMAATVLHRVAGLPEAAASAFKDVESGSWYEQAVNWAAESGVTNGVSAERFDPHASLTREQLVTFLYRYAEKSGLDVSESKDLAAFSDAKAVSPWAIDAMQWAVAVGIIKGTDKGTINPAGTATRAEFAAMLRRFVQWAELIDEP